MRVVVLTTCCCCFLAINWRPSLSEPESCRCLPACCPLATPLLIDPTPGQATPGKQYKMGTTHTSTHSPTQAQISHAHKQTCCLDWKAFQASWKYNMRKSSTASGSTITSAACCAALTHAHMHTHMRHIERTFAVGEILARRLARHVCEECS